MNVKTMPSQLMTCMVTGMILIAVSTARAGVPVGACTINGVCQDNNGAGIDLDTCIAQGGIFQGNGSTCADVPTLPAASTWGLVALSLLVITAGTLILNGHGRSKKPVGSTFQVNQHG